MSLKKKKCLEQLQTLVDNRALSYTEVIEYVEFLESKEAYKNDELYNEPQVPGWVLELED